MSTTLDLGRAIISENYPCGCVETQYEKAGRIVTRCAHHDVVAAARDAERQFARLSTAVGSVNASLQELVNLMRLMRQEEQERRRARMWSRIRRWFSRLRRP